MGMKTGSKGLIHWVGMGDGRESIVAASLTKCCIDAIEISANCAKDASTRLGRLKDHNKAAYNSLNPFHICNVRILKSISIS
jgi:hypothetical protein